MADIRVFEQVDESLGEIAINLDQVVRIQRHEDRGTLTGSPTLNLSALFYLTTGTSYIQVPIKRVYLDEAEQLEGAFEAFVEELRLPPTSTSSRRSRFGAH